LRNWRNRHAAKTGDGHCSICAEVSAHILRARGPDSLSRRRRHPVDADGYLPEIRIPVVTVIWSYVGLTTPGMEQRVGIDPTMSVVPTPNTSGCAESVSMDLSTPSTMAPANATGAAATPGVLPAGC
jgi:hypothetical protein